MQKNVLDRKRWETREELRLAIVTWIDPKQTVAVASGNSARLTPVEFEMIYTAADAA